MKKIIIFLTLLIMSIAVANSVLAQVQDVSGPLQGLKNIQPDSGYKEYDNDSSLPSIVGTVINAFLSLLGVIFVGLMIYAGFMWMTARGDEAKVEKAKDTLTRAIVGIVITLASFAIWNFVYQYFILNKNNV